LRHRFLAAFGLLPVIVAVGCGTGQTLSEGPDAAVGAGGATSGGTGGAGGHGSPGGGPGGAAGSGTAGARDPGGGTGGVTGTAGSGGRSGSGGVTGTGGTIGGIGGATGSGGSGGAGGRTGLSGLPVPPGSANVPKPSGTPGNITVINWAGFTGAVSYTFDDANSSQIQNYAQLQALGVPFTFYLWTGKTDASNSVWATAVKDGHELGNHTQSHQSAGTVADINAATQFITQHFGVQPWTMAAPNGAAIYTTLANGLFLINRGVADNLVAPNDNTDPFTLPCYIPPTGATASLFNAEVDSARSAGRWRIILVHGFTGGTDGAYQPVPLTEFINGVKHTTSLGDMWTGTVVNVAAYWRGQKAFSQATTTVSGSDKTWTWTLPPSFPPGKYLRVTVPGGTLTQNGAALSWDAHGYYEIALDAGSATVSP
jgi:peptidoglycan/xylan/chitin deacetylase (PgdA/CDA1 family)